MDGYWKPKSEQANRMAQQMRPNFTTPMSKATRPTIFGNRIANTQSGCYNYDCSYDECDPNVARISGNLCWQETYKNYGADPYTKGRRNTFLKTAENCIYTWEYCTSAPMPSIARASCVADPNEIAWNNAGGAWCAWVPVTSWTTFDPTTGPNINCPMPMLGLSSNRGQVLANINRMSPVVGGTHADVGLRWGARTLSPRLSWGQFFGITGREARAWRSRDVKKALILITDGENTQANDFPGFWGCSDTLAPGCTGSPTAAELNTRMLAWCSKLNNDWGVDVYTVAVNINNATAVNLLAQCAGDPARAFAGDASELQRQLRVVASQLFELHIKE